MQTVFLLFSVCIAFYSIDTVFILVLADFSNSVELYHVKVYVYMAKALNPPSTTATVPVTNFEASLIR